MGFLSTSHIRARIAARLLTAGLTVGILPASAQLLTTDPRIPPPTGAYIDTELLALDLGAATRSNRAPRGSGSPMLFR